MNVAENRNGNSEWLAGEEVIRIKRLSGLMKQKIVLKDKQNLEQI
jgi:hypothetical protein